jgi:hypothetical protein
VIATNKLEFGAKVSFGLEVASGSVCRNVTVIECLLERAGGRAALLLLLLPPVTPHQEVKGERRGSEENFILSVCSLERENHTPILQVLIEGCWKEKEGY